jgi:hypothetical protein
MCAAGSLAASRFGYPLLALHVAAIVLCGTWLLVNRATRTSVAPRPVRLKHGSLLVVSLVLAAEAALQLAYFADLDPSILTSCCATIFAPDAPGLASAVGRLPAGGTEAGFVAALLLTIGLGLLTLRRVASPVWLAAAAVPLGLVAAASLAVWIGPRYYGVASHRCPFCLLSSDHHYVGYLLYAALACGLATALASGALRVVRPRGPRSLDDGGPERRLCAASLASWVAFAALAYAPWVGNQGS